MIKKLLLILAFSLPLFAQSIDLSNTSSGSDLKWTYLGNVVTGGTSYWCQSLFGHNDSLYAIYYNGNAYAKRWVGGTTWEVLPPDNTFLPIQQYDYSNNAFDNARNDKYWFGIVGDYYYEVDMAGYIVSTVSAYSNGTQYTNIANGVKTGALHQPTYFQSYKNGGIYLKSTSDSLVLFTSSMGYDADTLIQRFTLPTNATITTWSGGANTNLRENVRSVPPWYGRRVMGAKEVGPNIYVWLANSLDNGSWESDTIYIYKANSTGLNFTYVDKIAFADGNFGGLLPSNNVIVGDSIYYFGVSSSTGDNRAYSLGNGTLTEITVPTSLTIFGVSAFDDGRLMMSVNDNALNNDSAKIYIRDIDGSWNWIMGIDVGIGDYRIPNTFFKIYNVIYGIYIVQTQSEFTIHTDAQFNTRVARLSNYLNLVSPHANDSYTVADITISWDGDRDSVLAYYSEDNVNWIFIDTLINYSYTWLASDIVTTGLNGESYIKITALDSSVSVNSGLFTYIGNKSITLLSPLDSSGIVNVGSPTPIIIKTVLVDSISIFYSVGDTTNWQLIASDIKIPEVVDTVTYNWIVPNIYGTVYLLATENLSSDTIDITASIPYVIGSSIPNQPQICWYDIELGIIENRVYYDQTCLWGSGAPMMKVTSTLQSDGYGYDYIYELCDEGNTPGNITCATTIPLSSGPTWVVSGMDTTETPISDMYTNGDTITYRLRRYYMGTTDSVLYCDDLVNNIDSLVICDLSPYWETLFIGPLQGITLYNIQIDKIQNDTLDIGNINELLNDVDFKVKIMVSGPARRGTASLIFEALKQPNSETAVYDIATMFSSLTIQRDYFRGIDPKARKKNR